MCLAGDRSGLEQGIPLPLNYCSFTYKRRFQLAALLALSLLQMLRPSEPFRIDLLRGHGTDQN
ncbi:MAG: hypothetical protein CXR30_18145 [Geobacter sp.]|nr:MAG: hypothetical protein CXR30_18145 [Geobacter sp.]